MRRLHHEVMTPTHLLTSRVPGRWADILIWKHEPVHDDSSDSEEDDYSSEEDDHSSEEDDHLLHGHESPTSYHEEEELSQRDEDLNEKKHHKHGEHGFILSCKSLGNLKMIVT
jgi:hypothetical protein